MNMLLDSKVNNLRVVDTNQIYAHISDGSVGDDPAALLADRNDADRLIVRCGKPNDAESDTESDAARLLASWSQAGWAKFDEDLVALDGAASQAGVELMVRPSSQGMLSDAICTMSWARRSEGLDCSLLLDPIGWITASMVQDIDDHLQRIADLCSGCSKIGALLIRSITINDSNRQLVESSLGQGDVDPQMMIDRLGSLIQSAETIIVLDSSDLDLLGL